MSIAEKFEIIADEVYDAGKKAQYDAFWDSFQQNGERTDYRSAFGAMWTAETFKPKYPIRPTTANFMFYHNQGGGVHIDDFVEFCKENNVVLDYSQCVEAQYGIGCLCSPHFGTLDFSNATDLQQLFYGHSFGNNQSHSVVTIDEFISSEITTYHINTFQHAVNLENIKMSGVVAKDITFQHCTKLTKASITSIINVLSNTTSGLTLTLSKTAKENAFTAEEWATLIATKPNWTISLV